jgi:Tfp pilus assembly protein PilF
VLAYRRGEYAPGLDFARRALDQARTFAAPTEDVFSVSLLGIALCELKLADWDAARQHLGEALAHTPQKDYVFRGVYGLAALAQAEGQLIQAAELAALVQGHRMALYEVKRYAGNLLADLQAVLPAEVYAAAVERGAQLDPDAVVAAFLQEGHP